MLLKLELVSCFQSRLEVLQHSSAVTTIMRSLTVEAGVQTSRQFTVIVGPRLRPRQLHVSVQALTAELEASQNQATQLLTWVRPSAPDAEGH